MLSFLTTPLFEFAGIMTAEQSLLWSFVMITAGTFPLWVIAGHQDLKQHEVSNIICILICAITCCHSLLYIGIFAFIVTLFLSYLTLREKEVALIGQADFMMISHWLTASFTFHTGIIIMLINSVIFLLCTIVYIIFYHDSEGKRWHRGKMIPILPPYAVTVCFMTLYQYPVSHYLFYIGW